MRAYLLATAGTLAILACSSSSDDNGSTTSNNTTTTSSSASSTTTSSTAATGGAGGTISAGGGGAGQGGGMPCQWSASNPCPSGEYCDAPGCNMGTCQPLGTTDDPLKQAVCGCDNVNYWNAATAAVHGMAVASAGECAMAEFCGGFASLPCPESTQFCSYLYPNEQDCNIADGGGVCWGMPQTCGQIGIGGSWRACFSSPNDPCLHECDAIKTQGAHWNDVSGCPM